MKTRRSRVIRNETPFMSNWTSQRPSNWWRWLVALLLLGCTLWNAGCADEAFIPPPDNVPPGQLPSSEDSRVPPDASNPW